MFICVLNIFGMIVFERDFSVKYVVEYVLLISNNLNYMCFMCYLETKRSLNSHYYVTVVCAYWVWALYAKSCAFSSDLKHVITFFNYCIAYTFLLKLFCVENV